MGSTGQAENDSDRLGKPPFGSGGADDDEATYEFVVGDHVHEHDGRGQADGERMAGVGLVGEIRSWGRGSRLRGAAEGWEAGENRSSRK